MIVQQARGAAPALLAAAFLAAAAVVASAEREVIAPAPQPAEPASLPSSGENERVQQADESTIATALPPGTDSKETAATALPPATDATQPEDEETAEPADESTAPPATDVTQPEETPQQVDESAAAAPLPQGADWQPEEEESNDDESRRSKDKDFMWPRDKKVHLRYAEHRTIRRPEGRRKYILGRPLDIHTKPKGRALIFLMHGFSNSPNWIFGDFEPLLTRDGGPVLVAPEGTVGYGMPTSWHVRGSDVTRGPDGPMCSPSTMMFGCTEEICGAHRQCQLCNPWLRCSPQCIWSSCVDDQGLILVLLRKMKKMFDIDPKRVYMTGFSMGGMFTWDVAVSPRLAHLFTAVLPFHGSMMAGYPRPPPTPSTGPWVLGLWGAEGYREDQMDMYMPPYSVYKGRPDKTRTAHNIGGMQGEFYYSTAENITQTYARGMSCPAAGPSVQEVMGWSRFAENHITCKNYDCGNAVLGCIWATTSHTHPPFIRDFAWDYFSLVHDRRYSSK